MARPRTLYKLVGRYMQGNDTVYYGLVSEDGKEVRATEEQMAFYVGREQVINVTAQLYKDKVLFRGVGCEIKELPIIQLGNKLVVGSYNFTSAALEGKNVEAALVFNNSPNLKLNCKKISESKFLPDEMKVSNCDEAGKDNKLPFVYVIVKWQESKIYIYAEDLEDNSYSLRLDGMYEDLVTVLKEEQSINISTEISNHILKHKTFSIFKDGTICFKGLINESDSGEYRPEFSCENLNDSIREWFTFDENTTDGKHNLRLINTEEYQIGDAAALYGFIAGILASNHDVTDLFVDSALKICRNDLAGFDTFIADLDKLVEKVGVNVIITSSIPVEEASETVKKYL